MVAPAMNNVRSINSGSSVKASLDGQALNDAAMGGAIGGAVAVAVAAVAYAGTRWVVLPGVRAVKRWWQPEVEKAKEDLDKAIQGIATEIAKKSRADMKDSVKEFLDFYKAKTKTVEVTDTKTVAEVIEVKKGPKGPQ